MALISVPKATPCKVWITSVMFKSSKETQGYCRCDRVIVWALKDSGIFTIQFICLDNVSFQVVMIGVSDLEGYARTVVTLALFR